MTEHDPLIERVVSELSRPVPVDQAAKARVVEEVRRARRRNVLPSLARPRGRIRAAFARSPAWIRGTGPRTAIVAAAAALVLLFLAGELSWWRGAGDSTGDAANQAGPTPVQFVLVAKDASRVNLVGDFNDWDRGATPLRPSASGDVWSVTVSLAPGPYRYAFVVDGERWVADVAAPQAAADDYGLPSSLIVVPESAT